MNVRGMTCAGCEEHVTEALKAAGAHDVTASFRRGEARFWLPAGTIELAPFAAVVKATGYEPVEVEIAQSSPGTEPPGRLPGAEYDLAIIGSGGAAFSAAIQARRHGARVAMIERGVVGGTCVNIGCVPSKTMLRAGEIYYQARNHPFAGIQTQAAGVDMGLLVGQKNELVGALRQDRYVDLIGEYGLDLIRQEARFLDGHTLQVGDRTVTANAFLIATGAAPAIPDIPGLQDVNFLTSTSALELKTVPRSLAVIGAGYIALELGQLFRHLGAHVTLMQRSQQLLKAYEPEIATAMEQVLTRQGTELLTGVQYERVEHTPTGVRVHVTHQGRKREIEAEQLLVAVGRQPNTAPLHLDRAGVRTGERGEVLADDRMRTSNPRIFAAGDVTLGPQFVYVAAYQGAVAADNALGAADRKADLSVVPAVTFTHPSIATVGLTEVAARAAGHEVRTSVLPLEAVPRALVNRETAGVFKLVADAATGRLLGAHVLVENAGDVIYAATLAVKFGLTVQNLKETLAPYLTMAEGLKLAALTFDTDVTKLSCCAG